MVNWRPAKVQVFIEPLASCQLRWEKKVISQPASALLELIKDAQIYSGSHTEVAMYPMKVPIYKGREEGKSRWSGLVQESFLEEGEFESGLVRCAEFTERLKEGTRVSHARPGQKSGLIHTAVWDVHCSAPGGTLGMWPMWLALPVYNLCGLMQSPWRRCWDRCLPGP